MKKTLLQLVLVVIVGAIVYGGYVYWFAPEQAYCQRFVQLCELEDESALETCGEVLAAVAEEDAGAVRDAARCAVEASKCTTVTGCLVGAGTAVGLKKLDRLVPFIRQSSGGVEDFLEGVKKGAGDLLE